MQEIVQGRLSQDEIDWTVLVQTNCSDTDRLKSLIDRGGWTAAVDFPASLCWEQLVELYPDAKVIHTERNTAEKWWDSASNSIMTVINKPLLKLATTVIPIGRTHKRMINAMWSFLLKKQVSVSDHNWPHVYKDDVIAAYNENNERVREVVSSTRLLVQDHSKGWNLLAEFLDKPIPSKPYPHKNTRSEFMGRARNMSFVVALVAVALIAAVLYLPKGLAMSLDRQYSHNKKESRSIESTS